MFRRGLTFVVICATLTFRVDCAEKFIYIYSTVPEDTNIKSDNYPQVYSPMSNFTWVWETTRGQWGVYFRVFDLSRDENFNTGGDWLSIQGFRNETPTFYTSSPDSIREPYFSRGTRLAINFVSDEKKDFNVRGFDLQIFFGNSESEIRLKIHESGKDDQTSSVSLIVVLTIAISAMFLLVAAVICGFTLKARRKVVCTGDRNVFGVRLGSGVRHSRHSSSPPLTPNRDVSAPGQQLIGETQRQNSRLDWMARAELTTSMSTLQRNRNLTPAHAAVEQDQHEDHLPNGDNRHVEEGFCGNQAESASGCMEHPGVKEIQQVFECVSDRVGKLRDTSHSFRFKSDLDLKPFQDGCSKEACCHAPSKKKQTNTYMAALTDKTLEETNQKIVFMTEMDGDLVEGNDRLCPPSYESLAENCSAAFNTGKGCYGNVEGAHCYSNDFHSDNSPVTVYINAVQTMPDTHHEQTQGNVSSTEDAMYSNLCKSALLPLEKTFTVTDHSFGPNQRENSNYNLDPKAGHTSETGGPVFNILDLKDQYCAPAALSQFNSFLHVMPAGVREPRSANDMGYMDMLSRGGGMAENIYTNSDIPP